MYWNVKKKCLKMHHTAILWTFWHVKHDLMNIWITVTTGQCHHAWQSFLLYCMPSTPNYQNSVNKNWQWQRQNRSSSTKGERMSMLHGSFHVKMKDFQETLLIYNFLEIFTKCYGMYVYDGERPNIRSSGHPNIVWVMGLFWSLGGDKWGG